MKKNTLILSLTIVMLAMASVALGQQIKQYSNPGYGPRQVYIPGGSFFMGGSLPENIAYSNDVHKREVRVKDLLMDEHEVTNKQWKEFVAAMGAQYTPSDSLYFSYGFKVIDYYNSEQYDDFPVVGITWEQAMDYCKWRSEQVKDGQFRLPTEEEWEYAAIALHPETTISKKSKVNFEIVTAGKIYPWYGKGVRLTVPGRKFKNARGNFLANFVEENNSDKPVKVGEYWPNDFYLYDMAGNVNEWVYNQYLQFPEAKQGPDRKAEAYPSFGVTSLINEKSRVIKGGSYKDEAYWLIPATRRYFQQDQASEMIGFRTVRDFTQQQIKREDPLNKRSPLPMDQQ